VGFFVLSFLLLLLLVFLVNFTGYAYRQTRQTYEYYKGVADISTCTDRLDIVHETEIENYGCPAKYIPYTSCPEGNRLTIWEGTSSDNSGVKPASMLFDETDLHTTSLDGLNDNLLNAQTDWSGYWCLNTNCCGLLGQLYTVDLLSLANFGLLTTLAGCLVSVGCYYFWYVTWIDTTRNKGHDFLWLGIMAIITLVFLVFYFAVDLPLISERLDPSTDDHL